MCHVPFFHWVGNGRPNLSQSTSPIARQIDLVGQTKLIDRREIQSYNNHAYKNSVKTQHIFMNNLNINPQFIGSQQTHCKEGLHRIDHHGNRGELLIEDHRERERHIGTRHGPVDLW